MGSLIWGKVYAVEPYSLSRQFIRVAFLGYIFMYLESQTCKKFRVSTNSRMRWQTIEQLSTIRYWFSVQVNFYWTNISAQVDSEDTLTSIWGIFRKTKEMKYNTHETAVAVTMLLTRRLLSLLGTNAIFNVFVKSKSL